ncbi:MAG TPA: metal-dependent transcriptional regulator [Candidatus Nitrosocosmicus sp.]
MNSHSKDSELREQLFVGTAEAEHVEMYLKAMWSIIESGQELKVSSIAKVLNVTQPSVVQMLHKLNDARLIDYKKGSIVVLTTEGEKIGKQMIRNTRLLEVLMKDALKIDIDEEMVCGIEHHMKEIFTEALCTLLKHPKICPHGYNIPIGSCCIEK